MKRLERHSTDVPALASANSPRPLRCAAPAGLEPETVRRAAMGDRRAMAWVAARVLPAVRCVARSLARNVADADDAAQSSLVEILRSLHSYRGDATLDRWAARIAVRTTLRLLGREQRRRAEALDERGPMLCVVADETALAERLPKDVRVYLARLPDPQRTAMILHHAHGYTLEEIATAAAVSRDTVKSRLRLATATLRRWVEADQSGHGSAP